MVEALSANSQAIQTELHEHYLGIPFIQELLPRNVRAIIEYQHEVERKLRELLMDQRGWHQATQLVQVAGTKLGYLVPSTFPEVAEEARASLEQIHRTFREESGKFDLPKEVHFTFLKGNGAEGKQKDHLSLFNGNLLFMPDDYTWFFGGCSRYEKRVDALAEKIIETQADLVCLQEIHDVESSDALYEKLKDTYPYFYLNIGQGDYTKDPTGIMMNSGLFVASKYPIESPTFIPFRQEGRQWQINKGYFFGTVLVEGTPYCYLYTTHLNPFDDENAQSVRKLQAQEVTEQIESQHLPIPTFVVGDLNVNKGTSEWDASPLSQNFIHHFFGDLDTCTDTLNEYVNTPKENRNNIEREGHLCDYALMSKKNPGTIDSHLVLLYDLDDPENALSDHHGILSIVSQSFGRE